MASTGRALAGVYPLRLPDLARALAEPALLGSGLRPWDPGMGALLASRLLEEEESGLNLEEDLPRPPVARLLARTLAALRQAGVAPRRIQDLAASSPHGDDARRLAAVARMLERYNALVEERFADPTLLLRTAAARVSSSWLRGLTVLVVDEWELEPLEEVFLSAVAAVARVQSLARPRPPALAREAPPIPSTPSGVGAAAGPESQLWAGLLPPATPASLSRLGERLFEPPAGEAVEEGSVELLTAPGEAAEVRSIGRRLLREAARGVPFEEMAVLLPRADEYALLLSDLLGRLAIPYRLHPSLPLHTGRAARSLLLLLRCRGLSRSAVMEFLTFAPVPWDTLLGPDAPLSTPQWEEASRGAGVTAGLDRWRTGLRSYVATKSRESEREANEARRDGARRRAEAASTLLRVVEFLSATLDELHGDHPWPEWSRRLGSAFDRWVGRERDREAVAEVLADLGGLDALAPSAPWADVEGVLEARLEWERVPMDSPPKGGVHVGALDAIAGLPFRVVAIPGLVEGGYPGPIRPDPFLLDAEREALASLAPTAAASGKQLSLFDAEESPTQKAPLLPTTQGRLLEQRRVFHRALRQATERLILSYPRADPRTGRERLPSLFFVAAASAISGRALDMGTLAPLVVEDDPRDLSADDTVDRGERDRCRRLRGGAEATLAIASGSPFFKHALLADSHRRTNRVTRYDGFVDLPPSLKARLDPTLSDRRLSATRLHTYADCGFRYLLEGILHLEPVEEPEDRTGLDPLERGKVFHEVAERFLRERRQRGELPVRDTPGTEARLAELAEEALARLVEGSPPRHRLLWDLARSRLHDLLRRWLAREAASPRGTPAHFEVGFGVPRDEESDEPYSPDPLVVELGDGRAIRVVGKIDRIDLKADGTLVVRDYKAGRAPKDEAAAGLYRGGRQLQIPFYVRAAVALLPGRKVSEAFLDYVDGGRMVSFDPDRVTGEAFLGLLRPLVDAMGEGLYLQDASACRFCDFTGVCGPNALIAARQQRKRQDPRAQRVFRLKETP